MTYFEGFIVPVPQGNRDAYAKHASEFAPVMLEKGVRRMVESWDSDVPEGKQTDFRKAVDATPDEKIVFSFFEYQSRAERDAATEKMMSDPAMAEMGKDLPFDGKRMIMGGFQSVVDEGTAGGGYIDGIVVPVPEEKRDEYTRLASQNAKVFLEYGATRVVETLGDDISHGKVTDFYRAVKAQDGETVAFSFIEWPDKAKRDDAWQKIMQDNRMQHGGGLFDGSRMFWGGFDVLLDTASQRITPRVPLTA
ncbi:MAG TPA: DUF1428 domain-containing protein [Sphingomicrobium sp.]